MSLQHFGKGALRVAKNYTKGYSDTQAKVRDATSNDPWGPSGTQMNEIAQMTYNQNDFVEIMEMLDKRLNDKGKNWRHVFKSLTVLDYCLHAGSENVVIYFRDNIYIIKTLKEFQYMDEDGKDQGANVRQKAKDITNLLSDEGRLREERRSRAHMRDRMIRGSGSGLEDGDNDGENAQTGSSRRPVNGPTRRGKDRDEEELRKAIEESKRSLAEEQAKKGAMTAEERDLQQALRLSEEEEAKRRSAVDDSNASALFDDHNQLEEPTNNPFPFIDPTPYATGLQPQFTQLQPQFTAFNPYQQQAQQEAMQAEYARQQQEWLQQQEIQAAQAQAQLQAQQEEWLRQQQMLQFQQQQQPQQQPLMSQPTGFGSNNPFAPASSVPPMPSFSPQPSNLSLAPRSSSPSFNLQGTYANSSTPSFSTSPSNSSPAPQPPHSSTTPNLGRTSTRADQEHSQLANLFENREGGQDTFGNIGQLRYGHTDAGRIVTQKTGVSSHNPFTHQQQQQQNNEQPFFSI
jgi:epsin